MSGQGWQVWGTLTSRPGIPADPRDRAERWIANYGARICAPQGDVLAGSDAPAWTAMVEKLATVASDDLAHARRRVARHAADIGTGFRIVGEADERPWLVSPVPLMIPADKWAGIAAGVAQRADVLEAVLAEMLRRMEHPARRLGADRRRPGPARGADGSRLGRGPKRWRKLDRRRLHPW